MRVLKPDSVLSDNGAISSSTRVENVLPFTRIYMNAVEQAELTMPDLDGKLRVRAMDFYDLDPDLAVVRTTVGAFDSNQPNSKTTLTFVQLPTEHSPLRMFDHMIPEISQGMPSQPARYQKQTNAERLLFNTSETLESNALRAAQTKIDDDEIHVGDTTPRLKFMGSFPGKMHDTIAVVRAQIVNYKEETVEVYYTVIVNSDRKMIVHRDLRFDDEGDTKRDPDYYVITEGVKQSRSKLPRDQFTKLMGSDKILVNVDDDSFRAISYHRSAPTRIEGRTEYDPNRYFILITGHLKYVNLPHQKGDSTQQMDFVGVIEMFGGDGRDEGTRLILSPNDSSFPGEI